jgi:hypothetical protein
MILLRCEMRGYEITPYFYNICWNFHSIFIFNLF